MKTLKIAIPEFSGRISPMFDVAGKFYLFVLRDTVISDEQIVNMGDLDEFSKISELQRENVTTVICDSISLCAAGHIVCCGIKLFPNNSGEISQVVKRYLSGDLKNDSEYFGKRPCRKRKRMGSGHGNNGCKNIIFEDRK